MKRFFVFLFTAVLCIASSKVFAAQAHFNYGRSFNFMPAPHPNFHSSYGSQYQYRNTNYRAGYNLHSGFRPSPRLDFHSNYGGQHFYGRNMAPRPDFHAGYNFHSGFGFSPRPQESRNSYGMSESFRPAPHPEFHSSYQGNFHSYIRH